MERVGVGAAVVSCLTVLHACCLSGCTSSGQVLRDAVLDAAADSSPVDVNRADGIMWSDWEVVAPSTDSHDSRDFADTVADVAETCAADGCLDGGQQEVVPSDPCSDGPDCDDGNPCTLSECVENVGCISSPIADGSACPGGPNWLCLEGECLCQTVCDEGKCGADGCGGSCECQSGTKCIAGECVDNWQPLSLGLAHSCVVVEGTVWCWGRNADGQLGDGTTIDRSLPVQVSGLDSVASLAAMTHSTCALGVAGTVSCWGGNEHGQLGNGTDLASSTPVAVSGLEGGVALTAGSSHACLLKTDGVLWCWGNNTTGQIGNGGTDDQVIPVPVPDIPTVVVVAAGGSHSCAVAEDGIAWCWGSNFYGQLGDGSGLDEVINDKVHPLPAQVVGISGVVSLVSGWNHSCALTADALVACWGSNWDVELGTDTELVFSSSPVVPGTLGSDNISLHTGARHTCAGKGDGSLWCWGYNRWGQLGNGELGVGNGFGGQNLPAQVLGLSAVKSFSGGGSHSCALGPGGGLACWGLNSVGQLGDGEGGSQPTPKAVEGLVDLVDISGGKEFTCAAMGDGQLSCWGQGYGGQLGDGLGLPSKVPTSVLVEGSVSDFDVGAEHACAIDDGGDVYCWGSGSNGKLGNGDDESQSEPVLAMGGALQVSCGGYHTCLVAVDGQAWCWGDRHWGQLGNGAEWLGYSAFPVKPVGLPEVTYVSAGGGHTCAVEQGGQVWCWGKNGKGQVGVSNLDYKQLPFAEGYPVAVVGIDSAASLATGDSHTCVLSTDGSVTCWGDNEEGQLGNGELGVGGFQPVQVAGLEDVQSLCAGANHNCALVANGTVKCWGANDHAQVGAASPGKQLTPQTVAGLSEVASIGCGDRHSCAVLKDGTAMCWGDNRRGQLGYGNAWALLPQPVVGFPEL